MQPYEIDRDAIATIWQELLGVDVIDDADSFFDLHGESLQLVELHARLEAQAKRELPIDLVLDNDVFRDLVAAFRSVVKNLNGE